VTISGFEGLYFGAVRLTFDASRVFFDGCIGFGWWLMTLPAEVSPKQQVNAVP
jgi:hypothetical protein